MNTHRRNWQPRAPHHLLIMLAMLACADSPQAPHVTEPTQPARDTKAPTITASLSNTRLTSPGSVLLTVESNEILSRVEVGRDDGKAYYADAALLEKNRDTSARGFTYRLLQPTADGGNGTRSFVVAGVDVSSNVGHAEAGRVVVDNRWQTMRSLDANNWVHLDTDDMGHIVTAAESSGDVVIIKHAPDGGELWTRSFGGPDFESLWSFDVSASGQIVIAGMSATGNGVPARCFIASFAADGTPGSVFRLDDNLCLAAAVDVGGNVIVAGYSQNTSDPTSCAFLVKLSSAGTPIWRREFGSAGSGRGCDSVSGIAVDAQGNVYVGGSTQTGGTFDGAPTRGLRDGFAFKYDSAGRQLWARQYGFAGRQVVHEHGSSQISLDPDGGILIAASVHEPFLGDALVVRYDANGALLWSRRFANRTHDVAWGVTADRRGVYVVGYLMPGDVSGDFKEQRQYQDGFLAFLSRSGELQSVRLLGDGNSGGLSGVGMARSGDVVATGVVRTGNALVRHPVP